MVSGGVLCWGEVFLVCHPSSSPFQRQQEHIRQNQPGRGLSFLCFLARFVHVISLGRSCSCALPTENPPNLGIHDQTKARLASIGSHRLTADVPRFLRARSGVTPWWIQIVTATWTAMMEHPSGTRPLDN